MKAGEYIRTLAEFVSGEIELPEFRQLVEERLFELRQNPEMTNEKRLLSSVELCLHEAGEAQRSASEVYAHVQSLLNTILEASLVEFIISDFPAPYAVKISRYHSTDTETLTSGPCVEPERKIELPALWPIESSPVVLSLVR